jgi:hypothetical protein
MSINAKHIMRINSEFERVQALIANTPELQAAVDASIKSTRLHRGKCESHAAGNIIASGGELDCFASLAMT